MNQSQLMWAQIFLTILKSPLKNLQTPFGDQWRLVLVLLLMGDVGSFMLRAFCTHVSDLLRVVSFWSIGWKTLTASSSSCTWHRFWGLHVWFKLLELQYVWTCTEVSKRLVSLLCGVKVSGVWRSSQQDYSSLDASRMRTGSVSCNPWASSSSCQWTW